MKKTAFILFGCVSCCLATAQTTYTLQQVLDSARENNIAMRNGRHDVASAQERRKEAYTNYFPNVSALGGWFNSAKSIVSSDVNIGDNIPASLSESLSLQLPAEALSALNSPISINLVKDGMLGGVTAVQPVYAGGRITNSNRLAKLGEDVSALQLRLSGNEVDKTAEEYYWKMVTLEEKMKTLNAVGALLNDIHKDVDISVKAGVALRNDLLQVELRQNNIESQKLKVNNGMMLMRMLIAQFCGLRDTSFVLSYSPKAEPPVALKRDHQAQLPSTAEFQLLGKKVEAANLQRKIAFGENLPTVSVGAGANYNNIVKGRANAMVFATVSVPISDWWGGTHAVRRRKIEYEKAREELGDQSELLVIRMQDAWNDVEEAYKQLGIAEKSTEQSEENLRLHRDSYEAGTATMSDLLEAQMLYQQAQDSRTDAFADYQNSILAYKQAVGL